MFRFKSFAEFAPAVVVAVAAVCFGGTASAQQSLTGTRVPGGGASTPRQVLQFNEPEEFSIIRRNLSRGDVAEARGLALEYVEKVEKSRFDVASRYYAYNALCVTYTYSQESGGAEEECSRAIDIMPSHWSAWNNRGTARMLSGNIEGAQEDYARALEAAGGMQNVVDMLHHNISLLDQYSR